MSWLRFFRRQVSPPDDGLASTSDAHRGRPHPRRADHDPEVKRRIIIRRRAIIFLLCSIFVAGSVAALFAEGGYLDLQRLRDEVQTLEGEIEAGKTNLRRLERQVERLERDPLARERIAREELGLVRPGEIDFLLPKEPESEGSSEP